MGSVLAVNDYFMEITNEMIYKMLKDFKDSTEKRFEQVEKRLDNVEQRSLGLEQRFEMLYDMLKEFKADTNRRLDKIEAQQLEDRRILMNLWEYRDNMKLSFTRTLLTVTGLVSGVVAVIVSFITGKAIILKS